MGISNCPPSLERVVGFSSRVERRSELKDRHWVPTDVSQTVARTNTPKKVRAAVNLELLLPDPVGTTPNTIGKIQTSTFPADARAIGAETWMGARRTP